MYKGCKIPASVQLKEHQMGIEEVLQRNLNNERIADVYVLFEHREIHIHLFHLQLVSSSKLVLYFVLLVSLYFVINN